MKGVITVLIATVVATFAFGFVLGYIYPHPDKPVRVCETEDSPNCLWIDPDTGQQYWNDNNTGQRK